MPKANGYGEERQNHPNRQVHRDRFDDGEGPSDDSWIHKAYWNQSKPNPNYRGNPGS